MKLAEIFVGIRPDSRTLPREMRQSLAKAGTDRIGQEEGGKFSKGFGRGMGRLAGAAGAAIATLAIGNKIKESVTAASDLNETVSKTEQIFGTSSKEIVAFGNKAPTALGQSKKAALDANATFGLFGKTAGLSGKGLVGFTTNLTTLASDLASFNNTTPEQAIEALGAALRGENEPIRAYGVLLDDATLKAEGMRLGLVKATTDTGRIQAAQIRAEVAQRNYNKAVKEHGKNSTEAKTASAGLLGATNTLKKLTEGTIPPLTQQQKVLAANSVIFRQTGAAQGDFARTSQGLANQQRIAAAQSDRLKVAIGNALLPVVLQGATVLNQKFLPPLIALAEKHGPAVAAALSKIAGSAGPAFAAFFSSVGPKVKSFADGTNEASPALSSLAASGTKLAPVVQDLASKIPSLTDVLKISATAVAFLADHTDTLSKLMPVIVAGILAYKAAQLAANIAQLAAVPTKFAEVVVNRQLVRSNRELIASRVGVTGATIGNTVATGASTAATATNTAVTGKGRIAMIAHAAASKAMRAATLVATGAQWLLNAALAANPIGLVIIVGLALAALFVLLWKRSQTFRSIVTTVFNAFKSVAITAIQFVTNAFLGFVGALLDGAAKAFGWVPGIGPKLRGAATEFGKFRDSVNRKLDGLKDQTVNVTPNIKNVTFQGRTVPLNQIGSFGRLATGGKADGFKVNGPGSTTNDHAGLFALSTKEWVINAWASMRQGDDRMRMLNEGKAQIVPDGELAAGGPAVTTRGRFPSSRGLQLWQSEVAAHTLNAARPGVLGISQSTAQKMLNTAYAVGGDAGPPGSKRGFRGVTLNARTIRMLLAAERLLRATFHITQGSYSTRVKASGSTHAGGGAMDTDGPRGWNTAVSALRRAGFAAWHRTPSQGPWNHHIHSIAIGDPTASPAAQRQVASFKRGGNGLGMAGGGKAGDFMSKGFLKQMGIRVFDQGGKWPAHTLGANMSNQTETVIADRNADIGATDLSSGTIRTLAEEIGNVIVGGILAAGHNQDRHTVLMERSF